MSCLRTLTELKRGAFFALEKRREFSLKRRNTALIGERKVKQFESITNCK